MGLTYKEIAYRLQIAVGTAHRLFQMYESTGDVAPLKRAERYELRKLDNLHEIYIIGLICENPAIYLREVCGKIFEVTGVRVSTSTVCKVIHRNGITVEPRLSGPPLSRTSIIDYRAWQFSCYITDNRSENGRVPQMCMRIAAVTMETCLLIFCACADNHVALLFINKVGGSRRGLSIQLSGIFTYPACFWNQGVRIIEVLLYQEKADQSCTSKIT